MHWLRHINPQLAIVWQGRWRKGMHTEAIRAYNHKLILIRDGSMTFTCEEGSRELAAASWIIIPPDHWHSVEATSRSLDRLVIHFDWEPSDDIAPNLQRLFALESLEPHFIHTAPSYVPIGLSSGSYDAKCVEDLLDRLVSDWMRHGQGPCQPRPAPPDPADNPADIRIPAGTTSTPAEWIPPLPLPSVNVSTPRLAWRCRWANGWATCTIAMNTAPGFSGSISAQPRSSTSIVCE